MTATTDKPAKPAASTRDRLPRGSGEHRGREVWLGVLGVLGLVVLILGVPAALVLFVGYPLPQHAPTRDWLTQPVTATLIINILACIVWVAWAHFTICVVAEWRSLRRGRLPRHVLLGGGSQVLARRLVAAALMLAGTAAIVPHGGGGATPAPHRVATPAAVRHVGAPGTARVQHATPAVARHQAAHAAHAAHAAEPKYYVVEPPHGRRYDSLWDIAQRTLGDPLRYKEIFALNKDRVQGDGRKLVDANLIYPGWELRLPGDASGPGVHVMHVTAPATKHDAPTTPVQPARQPEPAQQPEPARQPSPATHAPAAAHPAAVRHAATSAAAGQHAGWPDRDLLGGGLLLAGLVLALSTRRGPYGESDADEQSLAALADLGLATSLDRALRNLAAGRREQHRDLPQPVVAWVSADEISLNLAAGDLADPPAPWWVDDDGRTWRCRLAEVVDRPEADRTAAPFPALVSVGRHDEFELFVDFEQAPGLVGIGGDTDHARDLATGLAVQAVTSAWSDGARATLVGFADGAEFAKIDPARITATDRLDAVLDSLESEQERFRALQRELGVDGVLTGRLSRRSAAWWPHLIVLSGPPTSDEAARLQQLVGTGRSRFVVLVVGNMPSARWRFVVDGLGRLDLGVLGASARANRLSRAAVPELVAMLEQAARSGREQAAAVAATSPARAARADVPDTAAAVRRRADPHATVDVSLLGPVTITAPGPLDPSRRELATELGVAVALHPDGLHDAVLRASIWPRGVSDEVCQAALSDVVDWFGVGADGQPCITQVAGAWRLSPAVRVDLDELRALAAEATGPDELDTLLRAVKLFRGPALSGTPGGRYHWLAFARAAREARILGTTVAHRAAELLAARQRAAEAEEVLRRGLTFVPAAELLWRDLLRLTGPRGPAAVGQVADQMYETLRRVGAWPEPETDALVDQLAPGHRREETA
jgi:hypothetical protein